MNKVIEEHFVKKFVQKQKVERSLYELLSTKKRGECIRQLSSRIIANNIISTNIKITDNEIEIILKKYFDFSKKVYIISDMKEIDGTSHDFKEAFSIVMHGGGTYIMICGSNTAFMKDEYPGVSGGNSDKYILHSVENDKKFQSKA